MDHLFVKITVHLVSQPAHEHIHDVGLWVKTVIPDVLQNHRFGNDPSPVAHEVLEEGEFARLEIDLFAGPEDLPSEKVYRKVAELKRGRF